MQRRIITAPLAATARSQAGTLSFLETREAKVARSTVYRLAESGVLDNRGHGVLAIAGAPVDDLQRAWEAVLSVGMPCALRAEWALWARRLIRTAPSGTPQIALPHQRKLVRREHAVTRRVSWWVSEASVEELAHLGGLPVLSSIDSIVTAAPHVGDATLLAAVQEAMFRGELSIPALVARRRRGLPGSPRIGRVVTSYLLGHDSAFESTAFAVLTDGDLRGMHLNVLLTDVSGRTLGPVDGYHEDGAGYEADGRSVHGTRRRQARDRTKDALAAAIGVPLPRFDPRQIADGATARGRWEAARAAAREAGVGRRIVVSHLPGRGCCCGHSPTS